MSQETEISWQDFEKVSLKVATIVAAEPFKQARKPAYILAVDIGNGNLKKSSAQITDLYTFDELIGKQVICITNFPKKQIGPIMSEVLITGFYDQEGQVILAVPDKPAPNGTKLT